MGRGTPPQKKNCSTILTMILVMFFSFNMIFVRWISQSLKKLMFFLQEESARKQLTTEFPPTVGEGLGEYTTLHTSFCLFLHFSLDCLRLSEGLDAEVLFGREGEGPQERIVGLVVPPIQSPRVPSQSILRRRLGASVWWPRRPPESTLRSRETLCYSWCHADPPRWRFHMTFFFGSKWGEPTKNRRGSQMFSAFSPSERQHGVSSVAAAGSFWWCFLSDVPISYWKEWTPQPVKGEVLTPQVEALEPWGAGEELRFYGWNPDF